MARDQGAESTNRQPMNVQATRQRRADATPLPFNVQVVRATAADDAIRARHGLPTADAIAPGLPPTPEQDLIFHGGKTIHDLTFTNFYVGGDAVWQKSDIEAIDQALAQAMADPHLNNVMQQYFDAAPITSQFRPSRILPGAAPAVVSQGDVENLVRALHANGSLTGFDLGATVFNMMLPPGVVLNTDPRPTGMETATPAAAAPPENPTVHEGEDSLNGLGGYHGSVHMSSLGGPLETVYYAVGVFSETQADGTQNGIPVFDQPWKNVVATFYHELNEARTDADVEDAIRAGNDPAGEKFLGWVSAQHEECGDFPVDEAFGANAVSAVFQEVELADGSGRVPVQFMYSNAVHGPEGPIDKPH